MGGHCHTAIMAAMSKAFTRETDGDDDDDVALPPLPAGGRNYITPQGWARLRGELLSLIDEERPKGVEAGHWAAKNGDRSENGWRSPRSPTPARTTAASRCSSAPR